MLLTRNEPLLRAMIEAVLTLPGPITSLRILNPDLPKEYLRVRPEPPKAVRKRRARPYIDDKSVVLDVRVELADHGVIDIEMQTRMLPGTTSRFLYYWAREYANQLSSGDNYTTLHPVYSVLWLGENLHDDTPFHSRYRVAEGTKGRLFSDNLQIHTLELKKVAQLPASNRDADVDWGRFLTATDEQRMLLADRSPIMKTAVDALTNLSLDPEAQRIAWERDRNERAARHMMGSALKASREEGRDEGREEGIEIGRQGKATTLSLLLTKKFGALAEEHRNRVDGADLATLDRWFESILDAATLDDLFRQ
jgi:predicted transposase/invertase (TIGR01784 family)